MAKGYTDAAQVAAYLGVTLTDDQDAQAAALVAPAEAWLDAYTGRAWLTGAVTGEVYTAPGALLQLRQWPVASIESITATRQAYTDAETTTLTANSDYQARDLSRGLVWVAPWLFYDYLTVAYTPTATLPATIQQAATMLVAEWLRPALDGVSSAVKSYSAFGQVSVTFRDEPVSPALQALLAPFRAPVLV